VVNPIGVNLTLVVDRPGTYRVQITVKATGRERS